MIKDLAWLLAAGAIGTLARYGMSVGVQRAMGGSDFPWGTLAVNVLGCFLFGLVWALAEERAWLSPQTRFILLTGFMGAFTTFSTFAFETVALLERQEWWLAGSYFAASNLLGIFGLILGLALARAF
jgi:CrcB protein